MAGPDTRRLLFAVSAALITVVVYLVGYRVLTTSTPPVATSTPSVGTTSPSPKPCPAARLPDAAQLGSVVWVNAGSLNVIDLATCSQRVVVPTDVAPPVRFSPDGRWIAFGEGRVVPTAGGTAQRAFGAPMLAWEWSPTEDLLAGVTKHGGVLVASPGGQPTALLPDGSGVGHVAFSPDGHQLAIDRVAHGIQTIDVQSGRARTVFPEPNPTLTPRVARWTTDGRWILYWRGPVGKKAVPLDAVPASGGPWSNVFDPVLPYSDFISPCGSGVAVSVGDDPAVTFGKQIVLTGPPAWTYRNITNDFSRSWFWPACSPDGRWLAATDTLSQTESANHTIPRALWLLATDGSTRRLLVPGAHGAIEFPRWSADGQVILVVIRQGRRLDSTGGLALVRLKPKSGTLVRVVGPLVDVGPAPGPGGHQRWAAMSDWYQPRA